jgi:carbonic anhydrase
LGDIFTIRIAGTILNDDILGSMEYACGIANSKIIVVLGHTQCGAVISACNNLKAGHLTGLLNKITPAINLETTTKIDRNGQNQTFVNNVSAINVHLTINQIRKQSNILDDLKKEGKIIIVGGLYDIETGEVTFFE